jgi:hypothetical protein
MKFMEFVKSEKFGKITSVVSIVAAGIGAVISAIADQKKEREFEEMKKAIAELQNK